MLKDLGLFLIAKTFLPFALIIAPQDLDWTRK